MSPQEEELAFFYHLGLALSQWSFVESNMYSIIAESLERDDRYAVGFAMFAVENFRSKLAFSDALLQKKLKDKAHLVEWAILFTQLQRKSSTRNRLAHNRVMFYPHSVVGRRYALEEWPSGEPRPFPLKMEKGKITPNPQVHRPPSHSLCVRDIIECRRSFFYLSNDLSNFHASLQGKPLPHPESSLRAKGPPTIREIGNQIHEALGHPPKPSRRKS